MKETKEIKLKSVPWFFFYYQRKQEFKTKDGRDLHCNNLDFDYCRHKHSELSV